MTPFLSPARAQAAQVRKTCSIMDGPVGNIGYLSKGLGMISGLTQMKEDTKSGNEDENQLRWHWQRKQDKTPFFSLRSKQVKEKNCTSCI